MQIFVLTLFPQLIEGFLKFGIIKKSIAKNLIGIKPINIRDFCDDGHVDDTSYGGGPGMVIKAEPVRLAIESIQLNNTKRNKVLLVSPQGKRLDDKRIKKLAKFDNLILMDGDGEDRPIEIKSLIDKIIENPSLSVVAKRVKRSEGIFFQLLYQIHKFITLVFTGKKINFGNYSIITKSDVEKISSKASLWSSFSGTIKKNLNTINEINSVRGLRYFGPSQMSLFKLLIHSFSIIAVFKNQVFLRSVFMIIFLSLLNSSLGIFSTTFQILIVGFNLLILIVSRRENEQDLIKSHENLHDIKNITH